MEKNSFIQKLLNWVTIIIWIVAIWGYWGYYNGTLERYITILLSLGLAVQGIAYLDYRNFFREKEFYYIVILLAISLVCLVLNHSALGSILLMFNLCAIWYLSDRWHWTKPQIAVFSLFLFVLFMKRLETPQYNFYNSNSIGLLSFFMVFSLIGSCEFFFSDRKVINFLNLLLIGLGVYLIFKSHCRTGLLAIAFWCFLHYVVFPKWKKHPRFFPVCYWIMQIGTIIFVAVYTAASLHFNNTELFFGKRLFSGRDVLWYALWQAYKEHFLIGCGSNVELPIYGTLSAHNSLFNILAVFGLISFILLLLYIGYKIQKIAIQNLTNPGKLSLFFCIFDFIIALYVICAFETTLLWAQTVLLWIFPLIILNSKE